MQTLKRLFGYITREYKKQFAIVVICIILSAVASVSGALFLQKLIDNYITPLLSVENPVFTPLLKAICTLIAIYLVGIVSTYIYNRTMTVIAQGTEKNIRDEMFSKMQTFPIKYFDTNTHGDIMSHYTNDADTLNEMISRSMPQLISSSVSIIAVFCSMLYVSWQLTIFVVAFVAIMLVVSKNIAEKSGKYFVEQQKSIGKVNGYIEEMINGQKVIKVFTHEEKAKEGFDKINDELCDNMTKANRYANILMPALNNLGNIEYAARFLQPIQITKKKTADHFSESAIFCCGCLCFTRSTGNGHSGRYSQRRRIFPVYRPKSLWQKKLSIQSYFIQQNRCLQLRTNQCLHFNFNQLCWTVQFLNANPSAARTAFLEKFRIGFCDFHIIRRTGCPDIHLHHFFLRNAVFFQQLHQLCKDILCLCIRIALAVNRPFRCNRSCSGNKYKRICFYNSRITGNLFKT